MCISTHFRPDFFVVLFLGRAITSPACVLLVFSASPFLLRRWCISLFLPAINYGTYTVDNRFIQPLPPCLYRNNFVPLQQNTISKHLWHEPPFSIHSTPCWANSLTPTKSFSAPATVVLTPTLFAIPTQDLRHPPVNALWMLSPRQSRKPKRFSPTPHNVLIGNAVSTNIQPMSVVTPPPIRSHAPLSAASSSPLPHAPPNNNPATGTKNIGLLAGDSIAVISHLKIYWQTLAYLYSFSYLCAIFIEINYANGIF